MTVSAETLKEAMRCWVTGVCIVTSKFEDEIHGMTVNSFVSLSLDPPLVSVTLDNRTKTKKLVDQAQLFGVTILSQDQADLSDRFAGKIAESQNRFAGLEVRYLESGVPFIHGGLVYLECAVEYSYAMKNSTLFVGRVRNTMQGSGSPLVYHNRQYHSLED